MTEEGQSGDEYIRYRLRDIRPDHPGLNATMALVAEHEGKPRCVGSAFLIGPALGATAAHVVLDWVHYQERADGYLRTDVQPSVSAFQLHEGTMYRWVVKAAYSFERSDIAFLRFFRPTWWGDGPGQVELPWARLNLNPPEVEDEVRVLGYPRSHIRDGHILQVSPTESLGRVTEVTHNTDWKGRPVSHAHLQGEIGAGMSGGPCFDRDGAVVGVNSKGYEFLEEGPPVSFVALWWPAMGIPIDLFGTGHIPVLHLLDQLSPAPVGRRRVFLTSKGELRLGKVDPDALQALPLLTSDDQLDGWLGHLDSDWQAALRDIEAWIAYGGDNAAAPDPYRSLRRFFWSLEAAALVVMRLAGLRAGLEVSQPADWERLVSTWSANGTDEIRDELASLSFSWNGVELFEVRTFAEMARNGALFIQTVEAEGRVYAAMLDSCRQRGNQIPLPLGLANHAAATIDFARKLLKLASPNIGTKPS